MTTQENTLKLLNLEGRTALVTGGARNLGYDIACAMAEGGANVAITSRDSRSSARSAGEITRLTGRSILPLTCDVRFEEQVVAAVEGTLGQFGRLDILVNNAGNVQSTPENAPLEIRPLEEWHKTVDVNLTGAFLCSKHSVNLAMKKAHSGSIIHIGSVVGMVGKDRRCYDDSGMGGPTPDYAAAKGGLINLTRDMACYLARYGIRVNCVSPGGFHTGQPEGFARRYGEDVPLGRMGRLGSEMKGAVLFLASDAASYITGINLPVDGGYTAW